MYVAAIMPSRLIRNNIDCTVKFNVRGSRPSVYERVAQRNRIVAVSKLDKFKNDIKRGKYLSASSASEFMRGDPLINVLKHRRVSKRVNSTIRNTRSQPSDYFFINNGNEFEDNVMKAIEKKFPNDIIDIDGFGGFRTDSMGQKLIDTRGAMMNGVNIIYQGIVFSEKNKWYGFPDMLVRSDFINKLITKDTIITPKVLTKIHEDGRTSNYHYVVIDIKWCGLQLRSNGRSLSNSGNHMSHKSQLHIYNQCLSEMQCYTPEYSYILGKGYRYINRGISESGSGAFLKLGVMEHNEFDSSIAEKVNEAMKWINDVNKYSNKYLQEVMGADDNKPLSRIELYPNMCADAYESKHQIIKKQIAERIGEITQCWQCGVSHRQKAIDAGIHTWHDSRFTAELVGLKGDRAKTLNAILDVNRGPQLYDIPKSGYTAIEDLWGQSADSNSSSGHTTDLFVDFETTNFSIENTSPIGLTGPSTMIFMIGVGWKNVNNQWKFKDFTVNRFTLGEETRICELFMGFISTFKNPRLLHYHQAEVIHWGNVQTRNFDNWNDTLGTTGDLNWFDLHTLIQQNNIVVNGALDFKLKSFAGALERHGLIKSSWGNAPDSIDNGNNAMLVAIECNHEATARRVALKQVAKFASIVFYNEVDCRVLSEIKEFLIGALDDYNSLALSSDGDSDSDSE